MSALTILTAIVGSVAAVISFCLFCYFIRSSTRIGKSSAYVFLAEFVGLLVTVIFSIGEGVFVDTIPLEVATAMRWVMFGAATASSIHMAVSIERIATGKDR